MKSAALPSFWEAYQRLDKDIQRRASKAFSLWQENPFHPSLHFKCINAPENIWSVRIHPGIPRPGCFRGGWRDLVLDWKSRRI